MLKRSLAGLSFWVLVLASLVWSQTALPATPAQPTQEQKPAGGTPTATPQQQGASGENGDASAGGSPAATQEEKKISPSEADELFRSVDEILQFSSKDTAFPIKHEVKRRLIGRDEVAAYVEKHTTEDEDAKRLRRSEVVLKKFGLLPRDFDLSKFLVALLRE